MAEQGVSIIPPGGDKGWRGTGVGNDARVGGETGPQQRPGNTSALISLCHHHPFQLQGWMALSCASPRPHNHAPALTRLPNCCIFTEGCCSLLRKEPSLPSQEEGHEEQAQQHRKGLPPLPWDRAGIDRRMDRQVPSPTLPLQAEPSPPAWGGKLSAGPNIAVVEGRRSQNN